MAKKHLDPIPPEEILLEEFMRPMEVRAHNRVKHVLRWHDFGAGREAGRSEYREYSQGQRQSHGPKFVPAPPYAPDYTPALPGVAAKIAPDFVGRLAHIRDMRCAVLRISHNFGSQRTRVSFCYGL